MSHEPFTAQPRQIHEAAPQTLDGLQPFAPEAGRDPATILYLAHQILGMSVTFYSQIDAKMQVIQDVYRDATTAQTPQIAAGDIVPLGSTYCQFVYRSGQPLVVTDAAQTAPFAQIPATQTQHIGSYVGVPLLSREGTILGTLCGFSSVPTTITTDQLVLLQLLGHALAAVLDHQELLAELERKQQEAALALSDALTGLPNRRAFDAALEAGVVRAASDGTSLALIFIDIDHFKTINDQHGHLAGDAALKLIAARLASALGRDRQVYRFGGEELVVVLPGVDASTAAATSELLREAVRAPWQSGEHALDATTITLPPDMHLTASFGIAAYPADAAGADELIRRADSAMYHAKVSGRDRCCRASEVGLHVPTPNTDIYTVRTDINTQIANALAVALSAHDDETGDHCLRMMMLTEEIVRGMGHSPHEAKLAGVAARLHDIGKVGVSDTILHKQDPLTEDDWAIIHRHPEIGEAILRECGGALGAVASVVVAHHERWDGTGYPRGLKGEQIPLAARVISVVDAFDAMISDRPYRTGLTYAMAVAELQRHAGSQFDPQVVASFLRSLVANDASTKRAA